MSATRRLDLALIRAHPGMSRRKARDVIEKGQVSVDGIRVREPGQAVAADAAIVWNPNRKALPRARSSLPVLYEDDTLLIVDKPPGLLTVASAPGTSGEDTALARVQEYVRRLRPRSPYVGVVHRMDRDTSGALAFALSPEARQGLRTLFRGHRIERRYLALVRGHPPADQGVVDLPIHEVYEGGKRRIARPGEPALPALTRWRVLQSFARAALLEVSLETGRQHQIRVHLAHIGLPILGDPVYGGSRAGSAPPGVRRQMLHARLLAFTHPSTGEPVHAESPLPADFEKALAAQRRAPTDLAQRARGARRPRSS